MDTSSLKRGTVMENGNKKGSVCLVYLVVYLFLFIPSCLFASCSFARLPDDEALSSPVGACLLPTDSGFNPHACVNCCLYVSILPLPTPSPLFSASIIFFCSTKKILLIIISIRNLELLLLQKKDHDRFVPCHCCRGYL